LYRFARKYRLAYSARPVAWEELTERQRTPAPGPQQFIGMLSREVDGQLVVLQWSIVQIDGGRSRKPPPLAVALNDLKDDIIGTTDRLEHGDTIHPEDLQEHERVVALLRQMLSEDGYEEFLDVGVAEFTTTWGL
jgi:hypothetical protein